MELNLKKAKEEVRKFIMAEEDPRDPSGEDRSQYLFFCPECGKETFIPLEDFNSYECRYCKHSEDVGECTVGVACNSQKIPISYLHEWNKEERGFICEDCEDHINHQIEKNK